jgi:ribosomal protein L20A (L18A)
MTNWTVQGSFYARRGYWQSFTKHCDAPSADAAREWALSEIGGCHHVKRHEIRIGEITAAAV